MATDDKRTNITTKRLLGKKDLDEYWLQYLLGHQEDFIEIRFPTEGYLYSAVDIDITTADEFSITPSLRWGSDGQGHLINPGDAFSQNMAFENANTVDYYVGEAYTEVPSEIAVNPRAKLPEYRTWREWSGVKDNPDSASWSGSQLTLIVDSVTEAGVDNSGRTVLVWLDSPVTPTDSSAIQEATVVYDAPNNKVVLTDPLGQDTVSETASDYWVALKGPLVKKNTDLRVVSGVIFTGIVTGGGSGNPPTAKDLTDQYVYPEFTAICEDVIEIDPDGNHKIMVRAYDPEPEDRAQISVYRTDNSERSFAVYKYGTIIAGTDQSTHTTYPSIILKRDDGGEFRIAEVSGTMQIGTNTVVIPLVLNGEYVRLKQRILAETAPLQLDDPNTSVNIDLSSVDDTEISSRLPQNILGAINVVADHQEFFERIFKDSVLFGGVASFGAGSDVDITAGGFLINGKYVAVAADSLTVTVDRYLYVDSTATPPVYAQTASYPLPDPDDVLLAYVDRTATPDAIYDYRRILQNVGERVDIHVGGSAGVRLPSCHFATVGEAARMIDAIDGAEGRQWRILVVGVTDEQDTPITLQAGLTIEGLRHTGAKVTWDADNALFKLRSRNVVRNLDVDFLGSGALPSSAPFRVIFDWDTGTDNVTLENVRYVGATYPINGLMRSANSLEHAYIERVYADAKLADWGMYFTTLWRSRIVNCDVDQDGTPASALRPGIRVEGGGEFTISGCKIWGFGDDGIDLVGVNDAFITSCFVTDCADFGIYLENCLRIHVTGCTVRNVGNAAAPAALRLVNADDCMISGNSLDSASATTPRSISFDINSSENTAVGNNLNNDPILDAGSPGTGNFYSTSAAVGYKLNNN